jgi:hypothetical protein
VTPGTIPVFLNGTSLRAPAGATLGQLLAEHDAPLLAAMLDGSGRATDGRGIAVDPDALLHAGAIYRVFRSARRDPDADA